MLLSVATNGQARHLLVVNSLKPLKAACKRSQVLAYLIPIALTLPDFHRGCKFHATIVKRYRVCQDVYTFLKLVHFSSPDNYSTASHLHAVKYLPHIYRKVQVLALL